MSEWGWLAMYGIVSAVLAGALVVAVEGPALYPLLALVAGKGFLAYGMGRAHRRTIEESHQ